MLSLVEDLEKGDLSYSGIIKEKLDVDFDNSELKILDIDSEPVSEAERQPVTEEGKTEKEPEIADDPSEYQGEALFVEDDDLDIDEISLEHDDEVKIADLPVEDLAEKSDDQPPEPPSQEEKVEKIEDITIDTEESLRYHRSEEVLQLDLEEERMGHLDLEEDMQKGLTLKT